MIDPLIQKYCGWAAPENPGLLEEAFDIFGAFITQMPIFKDRPKRMMLWELNRKLLGEDTPNYPQQDGDCVSFGAKNGCEHLQTFQLKGGDKSKWRFVFPPYIYGISRVQIGGGRIRGAGSLGVWAAQGLTKFGVLFSDVPNVPKYSKAIAQSWGNSGPPKNFIDEAIKHLVKMDLQSAKVTTWEQLTSAIANGYPITVASNYGFTMQPQSSGFHEQSGSWAHQMCFRGNTLVKLLDGTSKSLKDLHKSNKTFYVYSYDHKTGKIVPKRAKANLTRKSTPEGMIRVLLDNDKVIECTRDHKFLMRDGSYKEAQYLKNGDSLMPLYTKLSEKSSKDGRDGYEMIMDPIDQKYYYTHKRVNQECKLNGLRFNGGVENIIDDPSNKMAYIHHKDFNKLNNDPDNLFKMLKQEHWNLHKFYADPTKMHKRWEDPEFVKMRKEVARKQMIEQRKDINFVKNLTDAASKNMSKMNRDQEFRVKVDTITSQRMKEIWSNPKLAKNVTNNMLKAKTEKVRETLINNGYDPNTEWDSGAKQLKKEGKLYRTAPSFEKYQLINHKVKSVLFISDINEETYCLEVEDTHNFALDAGVFVHNCIVGYDESSENPDDHCVCILNSWGNAHGVVTDKVTGEKWPIGTLRVRKKVVLRMLVDGGGDSWALSNLDLGFVPRKPLVESDFTIL